MDDWTEHAHRLAEELTRAGVLTDPAWRRAIEHVPRHLLLPGRVDELAVIYSDTTLVTQQIAVDGRLYATSTSTAPSLMVRMLQTLDVLDTMTVLEVGTGSGYGAALLAERLGDRNVVSVDIDPALVSQAYRQLRLAGYDPVIACRDGRAGYPDRSPYERLIATVAFERIPYAWVGQLQPGGLIVTDLAPAGAPWMGGLARLVVDERGGASGRFIDGAAGLIPARPAPGMPGTPVPIRLDGRGGRFRATTIGADALRSPGLGLLIWQSLPGLVVDSGSDDAAIHLPDGSWARVPRKVPGRMTFGGPRDLWGVVEATYFRWAGWGRPPVTGFGLTVDKDGQYVWFGDPSRRTVPA